MLADASKTGWGACIENISTGGFLNIFERQEHINVLELNTFGIEIFIVKCRGWSH